MDAFATLDLDPVLHQPVRTRVVAYLAARGETSFSELKRALDTTDGNLEAHLKKLVGARYLSVRRHSAGPRPLTAYRLTDKGQRAFDDYVDGLQRLLHLQR